jgi:polyphosphate:AMP phosphotransferase
MTMARNVSRSQSKKQDYASCLPALRDALLHAQVLLQKDKPFAIALIVTGIPTAGRSETANQFLEWMNPKHIKVHALDEPHEATRPPLWRFWNTMPARGEIAIYFAGWYEDYLSPVLLDHKKVDGKKVQRDERRAIERIRQLEAMLIRDRVRVVKLHMHVDQKLQKERIRKLRKSKLTQWRLTEEDLWLARHYKKVDRIYARCLAATSTPVVPWHVIDGSDPNRRAFETGTLLLNEIELALQRPKRAAAPAKALKTSEAVKVYPSHQDGGDVVDKEYDEELEKLKGRLALLTREKKFARHGAVLAFEGMDAAGKGGAIQRVTGALDARQYQVVPVSAPSPEEAARPYLWRFWLPVPRRGELTLYDRSWYGRVLVERVRDLAADADWRRAYDEINEFELQLAESGLIVMKFWLVVSKEEQLKRFNARDDDPLKAFKVDPEDWANRRFYDEYQAAASDMIKKTDTKHAPWVVVEADDKKYARLKVLRSVCEAIEKAL